MRRATKTVPSLRKLEYEERLQKLDLPPGDLPSIRYRDRGDMIEVYKYMHGTYQVQNTLHSTEIASRTIFINYTNNLNNVALLRDKTSSARELLITGTIYQHIWYRPHHSYSFKARLDKTWKSHIYSTEPDS